MNKPPPEQQTDPTGTESGQPTTAALTLLHVEDNPADAMLMQQYLLDLHPDIVFDTAARLSEVTVERVAAADCALLDLSLPDATGLDALLALRQMSEDLPIIVLTGFDDMKLGLIAVRQGADDYLFKNHVDAYTLERAVQYAIERRGLMLQVAKSTGEVVVATASITAQAAAADVLRRVDDGTAGDDPTASAPAEPDSQPVPAPTGRHPHEIPHGDQPWAGTPSHRAVRSVRSVRTSELLSPREVAAILYVDPKTVSRWADDGKIGSVRTPGGHRRFFAAEILAMVEGTDHQP